MTVMRGWAYASDEQFKRYMELEEEVFSASELEWLEHVLLGASRSIDGDCRRCFWLSDEEERLIHGSGYPTMFMDLVSVSAVAVDGVAWTAGAAGDYILGPLTPGLEWPYTQIVASLDRKVWPKGQANVAITGKWGWPSVPRFIHLACLARAKVLWNKQGEIGGDGVESLLAGDFRIQWFGPEAARKYELLQVGQYIRPPDSDG